MTAADRYDSLIRYFAGQYGLAFAQVKAQVRQESAFNPDAVSWRGAVGLMQFMPATWEDAKRFTPLPADADRRNPEQSVNAGCAYMRWLLDYPVVGGDLRKALAAYNYGIGNVRKLIAAHGSAWAGALPPEPKNYISKIERYQAEYEAVPDPATQVAALRKLHGDMAVVLG